MTAQAGKGLAGEIEKFESRVGQFETAQTRETGTDKENERFVIRQRIKLTATGDSSGITRCLTHLHHIHCQYFPPHPPHPPPFSSPPATLRPPLPPSTTPLPPTRPRSPRLPLPCFTFFSRSCSRSQRPSPEASSKLLLGCYSGRPCLPFVLAGTRTATVKPLP